MTTKGNTEPEARMTQPKENDPYKPNLIISNGELTALVASSSHPNALKILKNVRSRPHPAPAHRTYESCHKHFSCPDGEECWYWSEDYYWDCGKGASKLIDARREAARKAREDVLDTIMKWKRKNCFWIMVDTITGQKRYHFDSALFDEFVESLRGEQEKGGSG